VWVNECYQVLRDTKYTRVLRRQEILSRGRDSFAAAAGLGGERRALLYLERRLTFGDLDELFTRRVRHFKNEHWETGADLIAGLDCGVLQVLTHFRNITSQLNATSKARN
jgi:hypothetical protein